MSDADNTYDNLDISIREMITKGREKFNACTLRWVSMQLNVSPDVVRHRCQKMQNDGLVTWNDMAGSLIVVEPVVDLVEPASGVQEEQPVTACTSEATTSTPPALPVKRAAKKVPVKKAAAKKRAASSKLRPRPKST